MAGLIAGGTSLLAAAIVFALLANTAFVRDAIAQVLQQNTAVSTPTLAIAPRLIGHGHVGGKR